MGCCKPTKASFEAAQNITCYHVGVCPGWLSIHRKLSFDSVTLKISKKYISETLLKEMLANLNLGSCCLYKSFLGVMSQTVDSRWSLFWGKGKNRCCNYEIKTFNTKYQYCIIQNIFYFTALIQRQYILLSYIIYFCLDIGWNLLFKIQHKIYYISFMLCLFVIWQHFYSANTFI